MPSQNRTGIFNSLSNSESFRRSATAIRVASGRCDRLRREQALIPILDRYQGDAMSIRESVIVMSSDSSPRTLGKTPAPAQRECGARTRRQEQVYCESPGGKALRRRRSAALPAGSDQGQTTLSLLCPPNASLTGPPVITEKDGVSRRRRSNGWWPSMHGTC